jgi:hypothetical protein
MGILKVSATIGLGGGPRLRIRKVKKTFRLPLVSPVSVPILKNDNLFLRGEFEGGERFGVRGDGDKAVTKTGPGQLVDNLAGNAPNVSTFFVNGFPQGITLAQLRRAGRSFPRLPSITRQITIRSRTTRSGAWK